MFQLYADDNQDYLPFKIMDMSEIVSCLQDILKWFQTNMLKNNGYKQNYLFTELFNNWPN